MKNVIYLTRTGLLEPLGQSQVLNYLFGLSKKFSITIISNERLDDLKDIDRVLRLKEKCANHNIIWRPQKYRKRPRFFAQLFNILAMTYVVLKEILSGRADVIHARSYIPATVAWVLNFFTSIPFIFDMRGLWPEELIVSGRVIRGSLVHKVLKKIETLLLRDASVIVSLTNVASSYLKEKYPNELANKKIVVIPTCTNLDHFNVSLNSKNSSNIYGCIGSITSGWFNTEYLSIFISTLSLRSPNINFEIVTRDNERDVRKAIDPNNSILEKLNVKSCQFEDMPNAIQSHDISMMFYVGGEISELGRSPTRMGEVLGCGLPVISNRGVGDVEKIILENNVGIIVEGKSKSQMKEAVESLEKLLTDPDLSNRCRRTAESIFSLKSGTEAYNKIYFSILNMEDF
jgi:glycosyltransferase involved in cell wall biosynthesis